MLSYRMRNPHVSLPLGVFVALVGAIALVGALTLFGLTMFLSVWGTGGQGSAQLPEAGSLARLGEQAKQPAREITSDPVLRQVDVDPMSGRMYFRFTDAPATFEIDVLVPSPLTPPDRWQVSRTTHSKLVGHVRPGLELRALRVGPADALRPISTQSSGCAPRGLTLVGERDALTWRAFCTLPDGRVTDGTIDGRTGAFQPSLAPLVAPPPTAVPLR